MQGGATPACASSAAINSLVYGVYGCLYVRDHDEHHDLKSYPNPKRLGLVGSCVGLFSYSSLVVPDGPSRSTADQCPRLHGHKRTPTFVRVYEFEYS